MTRVPGVLLGVLMMLAGQAGAEETHKGYEMPPYTVERAEGAVELRAYGPHLVAEVTVAGGRDAAIGTGFRVLAGYIFGGNAEGQKIAMTVPVTQAPAGADGQWTVRFMMPSAFAPDTLPVPRDGRIRFVTLSGGRMLAERFSGIPRTADLEVRAEALRLRAAAMGLTVTDGPFYHFYDAPMTLPWRRRNEVAFAVQ